MHIPGRAQDEGIRRAELIAALSLAVDVGFGVPLESGLRTCLRSLRLAERLGLRPEVRADVFHLSLLGHVGCTAESHLFADIAGDEQAFAQDYAPMIQADPLQMARVLLSLLGRGQAPLARIGAYLRQVPSLKADMTLASRAHCEVAELMAAQLGLGERLARGLVQFYERWDGKGAPHGLKGEEIGVAVRVVKVAEDAGRFIGVVDAAGVVATLRERAGHAFDPAVVEAFCSGDELDAEPGEEGGSAWEAVLDAEPGDRVAVTGGDLDRSLEVMASFADLKSFSTVGHSTGVARLAEAAARASGLSDDEAVAVRRAGLVHDVGRAAISVLVWDKAGPLTIDEREKVRLHTYYTERVLGRSPFLARLGELASLHHEHLDGSGYHRGARGADLPPGARLLAAADVCHALGEPRPHREARTPEATAAILAQEVREGRLDADAVRAVLEAAGAPVPPCPARWRRTGSSRSGRPRCSAWWPGAWPPSRSPAASASPRRRRTATSRTSTPRSGCRPGRRPPCSRCSTASWAD